MVNGSRRTPVHASARVQRRRAMRRDAGTILEAPFECQQEIETFQPGARSIRGYNSRILRAYEKAMGLAVQDGSNVAGAPRGCTPPAVRGPCERNRID